MPEYIERETLLRDFEEEPLAWCDTESEMQERSDWQRFKSIIEAQPAADVAPLIRCKDCKHSYEDIGDLVCSYGAYEDFVVQLDFYCAEGKSKSNSGDDDSAPPKKGISLELRRAIGRVSFAARISSKEPTEYQNGLLKGMRIAQELAEKMERRTR